MATDVREFEAALESARRARSPQDRIDGLTLAVGAYRGELWPAGPEEWLIRERQRLDDAYAQGVLKLIGLLVERGCADAAIQHASQAVRIDPMREEIHEALIRLYAEQGQPSAALQQYQTLERILDRECGDAPSEEITRLVQACATQPRARASSPIQLPVSAPTVEDAPIPLPVQSEIEGGSPLPVQSEIESGSLLPGTGLEMPDAASPVFSNAGAREKTRTARPRRLSRFRSLTRYAPLGMIVVTIVAGSRLASVHVDERVLAIAHPKRIFRRYCQELWIGYD